MQPALVILTGFGGWVYVGANVSIERRRLEKRRDHFMVSGQVAAIGPIAEGDYENQNNPLASRARASR
jgi:hypothetical protein